MMNTGKSILFTAPSGAGKSTLISSVLQQYKQLQFSISATTRLPRGEEKDGVEYYFISKKEFLTKVDDNLFLEWEQVYQDVYYGTLKSELQRIWNERHCVVFDLDVLGAKKLLSQLKNNYLSIFIQPPSLDILKKRLLDRNTDAPEDLKKRLERATLELKYKNAFDHTIINDDLETAKNEALKLVGNYLNISI